MVVRKDIERTAKKSKIIDESKKFKFKIIIVFFSFLCISKSFIDRSKSMENVKNESHRIVSMEGN